MGGTDRVASNNFFMIEPRDIKKMVMSVVRHDKGLRDPRIMHPARDWFIGIGFMFAIVLAGALYSAMSYVTYDVIDYSETDVDQSLTTYRAASVEAAIAVYTAKKSAHDELISEVGVVEEIIVPVDLDTEEVPSTSDLAPILLEPENEPLLPDPTPVLSF